MECNTSRPNYIKKMYIYMRAEIENQLVWFSCNFQSLSFFFSFFFLVHVPPVGYICLILMRTIPLYNRRQDIGGRYICSCHLCQVSFVSFLTFSFTFFSLPILLLLSVFFFGLPRYASECMCICSSLIHHYRCSIIYYICSPFPFDFRLDLLLYTDAP